MKSSDTESNHGSPFLFIFFVCVLLTFHPSPCLSFRPIGVHGVCECVCVCVQTHHQEPLPGNPTGRCVNITTTLKRKRKTSNLFLWFSKCRKKKRRQAAQSPHPRGASNCKSWPTGCSGWSHTPKWLADAKTTSTFLHPERIVGCVQPPQKISRKKWRQSTRLRPCKTLNSLSDCTFRLFHWLCDVILHAASRGIFSSPLLQRSLSVWTIFMVRSHFRMSAT